MITMNVLPFHKEKKFNENPIFLFTYFCKCFGIPVKFAIVKNLNEKSIVSVNK